MRASVEPDAGVAVPASETRRRRASRLSAAHMLIALAAIVAVVANYAVLRAQDGSVRVAVLATDVAAGATLDPRALTFADVRADPALVATLVRPDDVPRAAGHVAVTALRAGDLVRWSDLQPPAAPGARRAMSVPIAPERAAGGQLTVGDRVDVIEVRAAEARYVVTGAEVLAVPDAEGPAALGTLRSFSVTLAVDDGTALRLALAQRQAELHVVRATGASPVAVERLEDGPGGPAAEPAP